MLAKIDNIKVETAKSLDEIVSNIKENLSQEYYKLHEIIEWRENTPIALVGGGPSLKKTLKELKQFDRIIVCGSAHDYIIENGIIPDYAVIVDPDELVIGYLKHKKSFIQYFIASQCNPKVFKHIGYSNSRIFHAGGDGFDNAHFGKDAIALGGGCTVGTRALAIALGLGYNNIHLFGFDTCLDRDLKHHAYDLNDPEKETLGNITEISLDGPEGRKFMVAGYMLAQLFDFQKMIGAFAHRLNITVHGDGLLKELFDISQRKILEAQNGN